MTTVALRYAQALHAAAEDQKQLLQVRQCMANLAQALQEDSIFNVITEARIGLTDRNKLAATLSSTLQAPQTMEGFLKLLAHNHRLFMLPSIVAAFTDIEAKAAGQVQAYVQSAAPLTDAQRDALAQKLTQQTQANSVQLKESTEPHLLGGFRVFYDGLLWDASVRGSFNRLAGQLRAATRQSQHNLTAKQFD